MKNFILFPYRRTTKETAKYRYFNIYDTSVIIPHGEGFTSIDYNEFSDEESGYYNVPVYCVSVLTTGGKQLFFWNQDAKDFERIYETKILNRNLSPQAID